MSAVRSFLSCNVYSFSAFENNNAPLAKMNPPINPSQWIFCLNSFKQYSPLQHYVFCEDRDFTLRSCEDAILNNLHCHEDVALYIVGPTPSMNLNPKIEKSGVKSLQQGSKKYLDNLLVEARTLSQLVPKSRTVNYLHLAKSINQMLDPVQMTELMFNLSRNFGLRHDGSGRYVIELGDHQCNDNDIALIKGLGFNNVCIEFSYDSVSDIKEKLHLIRDYEFQGVHVRIFPENNQQRLSKDNIQAIVDAKPDSVCIQPTIQDDLSLSTTTLSEVSEENDLLLKGGYHKTNSRRYTHESYKEIWCIHDLLSIGIGGTSFIDNMFTHNADQLDQYNELIGEGKLPFFYGGYIKKKG